MGPGQLLEYGAGLDTGLLRERAAIVAFCQTSSYSPLPLSLDCRQALLRHALQEDREKLPETSRGQPTTNFERLRAEAERPQEWVRPGRFMQSLNALQQEMLQPSAEATGDGGAAGPSDVALERLESIRREALAVLLDLAGEGQPYLP